MSEKKIEKKIKKMQAQLIRLLETESRMIESPGCRDIAVLENSSTKEKYYAKFNCETKKFEPCNNQRYDQAGKSVAWGEFSLPIAWVKKNKEIFFVNPETGENLFPKLENCGITYCYDFNSKKKWIRLEQKTDPGDISHNFINADGELFFGEQGIRIDAHDKGSMEFGRNGINFFEIFAPDETTILICKYRPRDEYGESFLIFTKRPGEKYQRHLADQKIIKCQNAGYGWLCIANLGCKRDGQWKLYDGSWKLYNVLSQKEIIADIESLTKKPESLPPYFSADWAIESLNAWENGLLLVNDLYNQYRFSYENPKPARDRYQIYDLLSGKKIAQGPGKITTLADGHFLIQSRTKSKVASISRIPQPILKTDFNLDKNFSWEYAKIGETPPKYLKILIGEKKLGKQETLTRIMDLQGNILYEIPHPVRIKEHPKNIAKNQPDLTVNIDGHPVEFPFDFNGILQQDNNEDKDKDKKSRGRNKNSL